MQITIDQKSVVLPLADSSTLADLVQMVRQLQADGPRMVIAVTLNDEKLDDDDLCRRMGQTLDSADRIIVETCSAAELVDDALGQALDLLDESTKSCGRVVELLNQSKTSEAMNQLGAVMRLWQQIHEGALNSVQLLGIDPESVVVDDHSMQASVEAIRQLLSQIREVVGVRDTVLLADLLQYELEPVATQWRAVIAELHNRACSATC